MDAFLTRLGAQAMNMAIRSGIALTSTYAVQQCARLLKTVDDKSIRTELRLLQQELNERIKIISPAIDLIEFKAGRGNVFLENAVPLAKGLRRSIVALGKRLEDVACAEEEAQQHAREARARPRTPESQAAELRSIICEMKTLLGRIERDAHMLQFAISASGENLSTSLPPGVSPSRLMQASTFLSIGDTYKTETRARPAQGNALTTINSGNPVNNSTDQVDSPYGFQEGERKPLWQEVVHKARVRLCRVPPDWKFDRERGYIPLPLPQSPNRDQRAHSSYSYTAKNEFSYHLEIIEDLDDGRLHDGEGSFFDDIPMAGIRESIPVHHLSKIFYTNTGRILNIGQELAPDNSPALLLKRDSTAPTPKQVIDDILQSMEEAVTGADESDFQNEALMDSQAELDLQILRESSESPSEEAPSPHDQRRPASCPVPKSSHSFPKHLDPEWIALEVFTEIEDESNYSTEDGSSDDDPDSSMSTAKSRSDVKGKRSSLDTKLMQQIRDISLRSGTTPPPHSGRESRKTVSPESFATRSPFGSITSSLSLLEMIIRLASLQEFQQTSHLSIPDHILTFFLEETATTGLSGEDRWKARSEAKKKVGFDPYHDAES
ncbi:Ran-specific GTPase-activating protein 30 [Pyricularia oryzae]